MPLRHTKDQLTRLTGAERLGQNRESEYLGAEDIDPRTEPILTIDGLYYGKVTLQRGKEFKDVLSFAESKVEGINNVRPLIVNATNRKVLRKIYGDVSDETLRGKQIQLYVDHNVRDPQDGGITDGIRIRPHAPRVKEQVPLTCTDCGGEIAAAMGKSAEWVSRYTQKGYGVPLCADCAAKRKTAQAAEQAPTQEPDFEEITEDTGNEID